MEWVSRLNSTIDYIEEHLLEGIDYGELAKIVCCSTYHYQRMFAFLNNVPLSEYIRRRKMSLAAVDLQNGGKIIDVSLKYSYASPTAFSRAFQSVHGIAPSKAKGNGVVLKTYPPIRFTLDISGARELNYRIEQKDAFRIVGISQLLNRDLEQNFQVIPDKWDKAVSDGTIAKLYSMMNKEPLGLLGVSVCCDQEPWKYYIAVSSSLPAGINLEEYDIPASMWAVFSGSGTNKTLQELERRVLTEWLPFSGYDYKNVPDIEYYIQADPQNAKYEYWLPVTKKRSETL
jgi:Uncharacterized protein conserved in bacteria